ncbi:DUF4843 domain-containing protein [Chitinophaga sp. sic0106]|uniref:DUF4843 domain-containing protein n=1 Tax=Chitinophaga sp. sic0106 TaxID=2854785 RepID=UPI001C4648A9|nr:DUF4843 domain-containing protein [Chitinophaga sp. sic0106]MBV7533012.1 DUF4843 domain-containing protein [Chitinophaga sp. sic0106]
MKKYLCFICSIVLLASFTACQKSELQAYNQKSAVYFAAFSDTDSLVHSMVGAPGEVDTVFVKVKLLGNQQGVDRKISLKVDPAFTDATEGLHYEKLQETYILPAHAFDVNIPVVLYKKDTVLTTRQFKLGLTIVSSDDLNVGYPTRLNAHVLFTNALVKPVYWDDFLKIYYGEYSQVKHRKCIALQGFDFPATKAEIPTSQYGIYMSYGRVACKYYTDNIVYDENGLRILPWAAF